MVSYGMGMQSPKKTIFLIHATSILYGTIFFKTQNETKTSSKFMFLTKKLKGNKHHYIHDSLFKCND
jgi:hypothetical protein